MQSFDFFAESHRYGDSVAILMLTRDKRPVSSVTFEIGEPLAEGDDLSRDASLNLTAASARSLMNALWSAGVRPSDPSKSPEGVAGELAATKRHLEDMRTIAMGLFLPRRSFVDPTPHP